MYHEKLVPDLAISPDEELVAFAQYHMQEAIHGLFDRTMSDMLGTTVTTNSCVPDAAPLTSRNLVDTLQDIERSMTTKSVTKIHVTTDAVLYKQNRVYPCRRAKNEAHLRRMNNKWARRYGHTPIPTMYSMPRLRLFSMGGGMETILFIHPDFMKEIKTITLPTGERISDLGSIPVFNEIPTVDVERRS